MTSFLPAAGQYFAAIGGLHTLTESVNRFTTAFVGLVGSFFTWHFFTFFLLQNIFLNSCYTGGAPSLPFVKGRQR